MNMLSTIIVVVQVLSALAIIGLVLLQHGKGADMGAAFGSGASGSLFGATGSSNFLSKATAFAALLFFGATLTLALMGNRPTVGSGVMDRLPATTVPSAPANSSSDIPGAGTTAPTNSQNVPTPAPGNAGQSNQIPN